MKAGVFTKIDTIEYREIEKPVITASDMLIRVRAAAICGTDSRILHGNKTKGVRIPSVIGHEFSGEVVELGSEVKDFSIGDRVCVDPVLPCGNCQYCLNGMENVCLNREAIGYEHDAVLPNMYGYPGRSSGAGMSSVCQNRSPGSQEHWQSRSVVSSTARTNCISARVRPWSS